MRWLGLIALLIAEVVLLTVRVDTASLQHVSGWWAELARESPLIARIGIAAMAALAVFSGARLRGEWAELSQHVRHPHRVWWVFLVVQVAAFAGFTWLSVLVFEPDPGGSSGGWLFVAWGAAGLWVLVFWGAAVAPTWAWFSALKRGLGPLLIAAAIGVAAFCAGSLTIRLWQPLGRGTLEIVRILLRVVTSDVVCRPDEFIVGTSSFSVVIAPECSGYEGIGLIWVFLGLYLWFDRKTLRFPHVLWLLPLGTVVMWLANAVRIAALVAIGTWVSRDVAVGGFHSQAGWLVFVGIALGTVVLTGRCRWFTSADVEPLAPSRSNPVAPYLAPFLAIVAMTMVTGACSHPGGFDWFYPLRVLAAVVVLWLFRRAYLELDWSWSWPAAAMGVLAAAVWLIAASIRGEPVPTTAWPSQLAQLPMPLAAAWFFFRAVGYVVTVPVAEELAFRGYLTRRLIRADFEAVPLGQFSWLAFLVSSALFGALHGQNWLAGCVTGMLFAIALYRRGRIGDAIVAHATTNGLLAVYAVMTGNWQLWS